MRYFMKILKRVTIWAFCAVFCFFSACNVHPDAYTLIREAKAEVKSMKNCVVSSSRNLTFTSNGEQHSFQSKTDLIYTANPFTLKSILSSQIDGTSAKSETYTVTEDGNLNFYCKTPSGWQKTAAENLDSSPSAQIEILHLLNNSEDQEYICDTTVGSQKVHKIKLKLKNEALRSDVENIVTQSGMSGGSKTIVQTLLDSAPDIYGYCYVSVESGKPVRLELDAADVLNQIFQNIDGSNVSIKVTKCIFCGDISKIGSAPAVILPEDAKSASSVQAEG